ncbi:MAG: hypothetical protein FJ091_04290 [Deltaproteobacteria bacterium]|nr:hypothetical protein [Deltaproteobacteria bacterium]
MNWDAIGAVSEALGALAVFVTLVYLAQQVRHARDSVARATGQRRLQAASELSRWMASDAEARRVTLKANAALGSPTGPLAAAMAANAGLTPDEVQLMMYVQLAWWHYRVDAIENIQDLPPAQREDFDKVLRLQYAGGNPVATLWYESVKHTLHAGAVRYVDAVIRSPEPRP